METQKDFFVVNFTGVDLFRSGNATEPNLDKVRIPPKNGTVDIEIYDKPVSGEIITYVDSTSGGISTFDAPLPSQNKKARWWKIPSGTIIPEGLVVKKEHTIKQLDITHYTIQPFNDMPLTEYKRLLRILAKSAQPIF